jgi:hypothetical protein
MIVNPYPHVHQLPSWSIAIAFGTPPPQSNDHQSRGPTGALTKICGPTTGGRSLDMGGGVSISNAPLAEFFLGEQIKNFVVENISVYQPHPLIGTDILAHNDIPTNNPCGPILIFDRLRDKGGGGGYQLLTANPCLSIFPYCAI